MMSYGGLRFGMGAMSMGSIAAPFPYAPFLGSVGSKSTYFPGNVHEDARALNYLGFMSDADLADITDSLGTQASDIENEGGAWDPKFRAGITRAQNAGGITADSWVGPQTRTTLLRMVTQKNLTTPPNLVPPVVPGLPPAVLPVTPGAVPANPAILPGITPAAAKTSSEDLLMYGGIAVGGLALLGLGWWALK
jgi:hypothetical protein